MSKARKEAAKKKSVAQKAATRAKKLQSLMPILEESGSTNLAEDASAAKELFSRATTTLDTAASGADYRSAIDLLRQAIRIDPNSVEYFVSLSVAYAHAKKHDFALAACEMALQIAPGHPIAAQNRRNALKELGLPETTLINRI
jgi:tetratricopeptide (TPR) repeat protein